MKNKEKESCYLSRTYALDSLIMAMIPFSMVIWCSLVIVIGDRPVIVVPAGIILSVLVVWYFRNCPHRYKFYDDRIEINFLLSQEKNFILFYKDVERADWKLELNGRTESTTSYFMILNVKNNEQLISGETIRGWKILRGKKFPKNVKPGYCPILDSYDIKILRNELKSKFDFNLNGLQESCKEYILDDKK